MGLLDGFLDNLFSDDPRRQGQLAMALGLLEGGKGRKNFGADLSHGLMAGMGTYNQAQQFQMKKQEEEQQRKMRDMQMAQMERQNATQQKIEGLAPQFFGPQSYPQGMTGDDQGNPMPALPAKQDYQGYASALSGIDPMKAMALQSQLAAMNDKGYEKLGPGDSLWDKRAGKIVASTPDKPPAGFTRGPNGELIPDQAWLAAQKDIRAAGRPQITVDNRQENAFAATIGKEHAEMYNGLMKGDLAAAGKINKLGRLENLLDQSGKTGKLTPQTMEFKAVADSLGFKVDPKLPIQQAAQALSNEMALEMRNPSGGAGMPGAMSDADRVYLTNMVPNLAKTPEGNKLLIETARKVAQREREVAKLAREYKNKNGKFDEGFYQALADHSAKNPLFPQSQSGPSIDDLLKKYGR